VYERFTFDDKLKLKYMNCVTRQTQFTLVDQHKGPLSLRPYLIPNLCDLFLKMRDGGQPLSVRIVQPIISNFINAHALGVLGKFKVTLKWIDVFMKTHLDWKTCYHNMWQTSNRLEESRITYGL
jgi:hypothetical protein